MGQKVFDPLASLATDTPTATYNINAYTYPHSYIYFHFRFPHLLLPLRTPTLTFIPSMNV